MSDTTSDSVPATGDEETVLDMAAIDADIAAGAKAFTRLLSHASDDWASWTIAIIGLRALRDLAFSRSHTQDIKAWGYRQTLGSLLSQRKYSAYDAIDKQTRSSCYKLMDAIEEINVWYAALPPADQLRWKHPDSIVKHAPKHLLAGGLRQHNQPKKTAKKPVTSFEIERLKALLIQVIRRLAKYEPDAVNLLDELSLPDPSDSLGALFEAPADPSGTNADAQGRLLWTGDDDDGYLGRGVVEGKYPIAYAVVPVNFRGCEHFEANIITDSNADFTLPVKQFARRYGMSLSKHVEGKRRSLDPLPTADEAKAQCEVDYSQQ